MYQEWIQKFQKGGAGSQILERGVQNLTFQCRFPSFYKSLTNTPPKGGATARPAPPLNPRLLSCTSCIFNNWLMFNPRTPFSEKTMSRLHTLDKSFSLKFGDM